MVHIQIRGFLLLAAIFMVLTSCADDSTEKEETPCYEETITEESRFPDQPSCLINQLCAPCDDQL